MGTSLSDHENIQKERGRRASLPELQSQPLIAHLRRRRASASDAEILNGPKSADNIAHRLFHRTQSSLREECVDVRRFTLDKFRFLFPRQDHDENTLDRFERWIREPMFVSDMELASMITLRPSNKSSPRLEKEAAFYFRSYTLTCHELQVLLQHWASEGHKFDKAAIWKDLINGRSPSSIVTIRYVGKVAAGSNPYLRLMQDMRSSKSSYLFRQLHSTLQEVLPSVGQSLRSYLLCDSVLGYFNDRPPLALIDMYERFLIAFFGQRSLINRQNGGVRIDFVPPVEDEVIFLRLRTSFFQKFNKSMEPKPVVILDSVNFLFEKIQHWLYEKSIEPAFQRGLTEIKFYRALCEQATPHTVSGFTVLAFVGERVTHQTILTGSGFLDGNSVTARFVTQVFASMSTWEKTSRTFSDFAMPFFCFNNLYNWIQHDELWTATKFLREWCMIIRPLIVVTFGQATSGIALGSFHHRWNSDSKQLLREVGKARLSWYAGLPTTFGDDRPRDYATIIIPHLHPGRDAKSRQAIIQRRVYWLTHFVTITFADTAIDAIQSSEAGSFDRQRLCEHIMHFAELRLERAGFWSIFQQAKEELAASWAEDRRGNQHADDGKEQQDRKGLTETTLTVIGKSTATRVSRHQPTWYPDNDKAPKIRSRRRSLGSKFQKINHVPVIPISHKTEHVMVVTTNPDSTNQKADFKHPVVESNEHSNSGTCSDNDNISDTDSFSESEEAESYTFNFRDFLLSILPAERAHGEPGSGARRRQLKKLWGANIPALHENQHRRTCNRIIWENFMLEQPEDYWFIACTAAVEEPDKMCPQKRDILLYFWPFQLSHNEEWLTSFENRREALQRACYAYLERQSQWQIERKRGRRLIPKTAKEIADGQLHINPHGVGKIRWQRSLKDPVVSLNLPLPKSSIPLVWFDKRTIHFHEIGIDVKDENYTTFCYPSRSGQTTLPKESFRHSKSSQALILLWEDITGLKYGRERIVAIPKQNQNETPIRQYGSHGRPLLKPNHNLTMNPQNSPPQPDDAIWLLSEYLDRYFPNGGVFWTGSTANFPQGTGDKERFLAFLSLPEYASHPYRQAWLDDLESDAGNYHNCLGRSIEYLRDGFEAWRKRARPRIPSSPTNVAKSVRGSLIQCTIYKMGPRREGW